MLAGMGGDGYSWRRDVFAPGAVGHQTPSHCTDEYPVACLVGWMARFDDHACPRLTAYAGYIGGRCEIDVPGAKRIIERVDPDSAHLHEHLAVLRFRTVHLDQTVLLITTVSLILNGFQRVCLHSWRGTRRDRRRRRRDSCPASRGSHAVSTPCRFLESTAAVDRRPQRIPAMYRCRASTAPGVEYLSGLRL